MIKNVVLNLRNRPDRLNQFNQDFPLGNYSVFYAVPDNNPFHSFNQSMYEILKHFLLESTNYGILCLYEDDAVKTVWPPDALDFYDELPEGWDMCYLGGNVTDGVHGIKENQPVRVSPHLARVYRCWTTHAVMYHRKAVKEIVEQFKPTEDGVYDDWLSQRFLPTHQCYITTPMLFYQRPGRSDLWDNDSSDYSQAFVESDRKLAAL